MLRFAYANIIFRTSGDTKLGSRFIQLVTASELALYRHIHPELLTFDEVI
mgnify:FL=1